MATADDNIDLSDSDDDLLGITTDLVDIPSHIMSPANFSKEQEKSRETDRTFQKRNNYTRNNYRVHCKLNNQQTGKWIKDTSDLHLPTMEIIDSKMELKQNRYQRMREIYDVIGFIVNVHDAINFDIDLEISPELHDKYCDVVSNQYTYEDLKDDFFKDLNKDKLIKPKIGTTYRCRLRGIGMNQLPQNIHMWKSNQICVEVKQLIDRSDGWISCTLSDIDVYKRLLVDIVIHTSTGSVNLRDYLLDRMNNEDDPIFFPYSGKRERTSRYDNRY